MIKCGECGYENMDGLDYCDGCGAKLGAATAVQAGAEPTAGTAVTGTTSGVADSQTAEAPAAEGAAAESAAKAPTGEMTAPAPAAAPSPAPAAAALFKAKLAITRGTIRERQGHEFELETGNNLIGRWDPDTGSFPEVDLDADDPEAKISRKHALIRIDGSKITIEDIGSLNGTYVNRQPRLQPGTPAELKDGDEVIIGKTFLKLTVSPIS
jgi:hypothetical protein